MKLKKQLEQLLARVAAMQRIIGKVHVSKDILCVWVDGEHLQMEK